MSRKSEIEALKKEVGAWKSEGEGGKCKIPTSLFLLLISYLSTFDLYIKPSLHRQHLFPKEAAVQINLLL